MQKKQTFLLMVIVLMVGVLVGCGGGDSNASSSSSSSPSSANLSASTESTSSSSNSVASQPAQVDPGKESLAYEIVGPNQYSGANGETIFIGAIRNTGADPLPTFRLTMELRDSNGNAVASNSASGYAEVVWPGELSPFWFSFNNPPDWSSHEITADTSAMFVNLAEEFYSDFTITNISGRIETPPTPDKSGWYQISGTVTNNGSQPADYVTVVYMIYDRSANVKAVGASSADARQPGSTGTFEHRFSLFEDSGDLTIYATAVARASQ
jgi:hypothetical protein